MHLKRKMRGLARVALLAGLASLALSTVQTAAAPAAVDLPTQIQNAMNRGDAAAVNQLMPRQATPGAAEYFPARPQGGPAAPLTSTSYEELKACGFYPEENRLECTIEVKQSSGYGGLIGQFGSMEHVYFCVGVLAGPPTNFIGWYPLGIGSVQVHDLSPGAALPREYAVYRDVPPPGQVRMVDNAAHTVVTTQTAGQAYSVKAILSYWMPVDNCNATPVWGNVLTFTITADPIR